MIEIREEKKTVNHNLNHTFDEIKSFRTRAAFEGSELYRKHGSELEAVSRAVEWDNTFSREAPHEKIRAASWNIERGTCLEGLIETFRNDAVLRGADVLLLTETDVGMGRSGNRNVPREMALALEFNYCFAASYLVLAKGDLGEQGHDIENTLSLHGTAILSRFPIEAFQVVDLYRVKDAFYSSERRLGDRRGLICRIRAGKKTIDFAAVHLELKSSPKQRAMQMASLLEALKEAGAAGSLLGGDLNVSTYNLKNAAGLVRNLLYKLFFVGFRGTIENYMIPEKIFEKELFEQFERFGYDYRNFNDSDTGTLYYDVNNMITSEKTLQYVPGWAVRWLQKKLEPWGGEVPLRLDWIAGKGLVPSGPGVIEKPLYEGKRISDHNPLYVDVTLPW